MSLYEALGVPRDASAAQIRSAYRKHALLNHPDKNPGDAAAASRFLRVAMAFEVLGDERRQKARGGEDEPWLHGYTPQNR